MLLRFDPFREIDRVFEQAFSGQRSASMPMDAYRHGDSFVIHVDLPGVDPESIDVSVDNNVLTVGAERHWQPVEGDQVVASERHHGQYRRQFILGNTLDTARIHATYEDGVLTVTIPVAERAKPRKIEITGAAKREELSA